MKKYNSLFIAMIAIISFTLINNVSLMAKNRDLFSPDSVSIESLLQEKKAIISVRNRCYNVVTLKIKDNENVTLWIERYKNLGRHTKMYDFTHLPDGKYIVEVNFDGSEVSRNFYIEGEHVMVKIDEYETNVEPLIHLNDKNQLTVSYINDEKDYGYLKIYDSNAKAVFDNALGNSLNLHNRYDLSNLPDGQYEVVFTAGDVTLSKYVDLKTKK